MTQEADINKAYEAVIRKAWSDPEFKQSLLRDPKTALRGQGVNIPFAGELKVVESTADTIYLVLPEARAELSEDELDQVAGGQGYGRYGYGYPCPYPPVPLPSSDPNATCGPMLLNGNWSLPPAKPWERDH